MSLHRHQWVFAGEVVIPTKEEDLQNNLSFNRLEYCISCGAFRIKFSSWRYWYSDATKKFLNKFSDTTNNVLKFTPAEFKVGPPIRQKNKLGRGLSSLMQVGGRHPALEQLIQKGSQNAKNK